MAKDTFFHKGRLCKLASGLERQGITLEAMLRHGWTPALMVEVGHAVPVNDCPPVSETPDERIREAWGVDANFDPSIHPVAGEEPDAFDCEHAYAARTCGCGFCRALNRESAKGNSGGYQYSARVPFNFYDAMFDGGNVSKTTRTLIDQLRKRDAKGREKYGTSLDRKDLPLVDWLQHQTEELLDGAGYAQAAKREAERLLEIKKLAHELMNSLQPKDCSDYVRDIGRRLHQALLP